MLVLVLCPLIIYTLDTKDEQATVLTNWFPIVTRLLFAYFFF